jgi:NAD(P)H dehydrogenase (quinone)
MRKAFEARGDAVTVSDLCAMRFTLVLSAAHFGERERTDHLIYAPEHRRPFATGTFASFAPVEWRAG